ncbi:19082_t:CDS:2 [Dentiscutata erythropus]|uniref:19082_t:CDS:1 n=1 Tax=Dentiscutata erythropus TaxID=1348616 RepID=A0A9N9H9I8_9GLOM|nr:19082_t:CDS:2 [Dentiscutata erythropus]
MFTTDRSRDFGKWCIMLGRGILALIDTNYRSSKLSSKLSSKISPSKYTSKMPTLKKSGLSLFDLSNRLVNKLSESPSVSEFEEISKNMTEDCYRPRISSALNPNRNLERKDVNEFPSKRHSHLASTKQKRSMSVKLINSTAANRVIIKQKTKFPSLSINQKSNQSNELMENPEYIAIKRSSSVDEIKDKNAKLYEERPTINQPKRRLHSNKPPSVSLSLARRYLKIMLKITNHKKNL